MTMIGADVEALRRLASDFTRGATELQQLSSDLARAITDADSWQGPDATRCKQEWGQLAQTRMTTVAEALAAAGTLLGSEAEQQETGSAATGGAGIATTGGNGTVAAAPRAQTGPIRTTQQSPGLWADVKAAVTGLFKGYGLYGKVKNLVGFFGAMAKESFFARTRGAARIIESMLGQIRTGTTIESMLAKIPLLGKYAADLAKLVPIAALGKWMPLITKLSKFMPLASALIAIPDLRDGGGYTGLRGGITKVLAGAAVVGGLTLAGGAVLAGGTAALVLAAPEIAIAAGAAGLVYGAWGLANHIYDNSAFVRDKVDAAGAAISGAWTSAGTAVSTGYHQAVGAARSWAAGLLGMRPAGAGV